MAWPFCDKCGNMVPKTGNICRKCGHTHKHWKVQNGPVGGNDRAKPVPKVQEGEGHSDDRYGLFPYEPRPHQKEIVQVIKDAFSQERHIVIESGTGTGKTVCSLVAALEMSKERGGKIVYLTRTISQSEQVIEELRRISRIRNVTGLPLLGRGKSCLFVNDLNDHEDIPPHALAKICEEAKRRAVAREKGGCSYYANLIATRDGTFINYLHREIPTAEEFDRFCEGVGTCPYECRKTLIPEADVIIAPYVHMLSEDIRNPLLDRMGGSESDITLIVDEAHNIWDAARENESFYLSMKALEGGKADITEHGDRDIGNGTTFRQMHSAICSIIERAMKEQLNPNNREAKLGRRFLEGELARELALPVDEVKACGTNLFNLGQEIIDQKLEEGEPPISLALNLGEFLVQWFNAHEKHYLKTISHDRDGSLVAQCLEPQDVKQFFAACRRVLHMSGTLEPLSQYAEVMGLPETTIMKRFPSPFPPENRMVLYVPDVNPSFADMKKDPDMQGRIEEHIISLCHASRCNTMVFFRSYELMRTMRSRIEAGLDRPAHWDEGRSMKAFDSAIQKFKDRRNGIFFTVMGGRVSEGLDFPGDELKMVIIVGLPYPPPTLVQDELSHRYDRRYGKGKGWEYTSEAPALRKVQQAIGRLIRTETDRGAAILLDGRAGRYKDILGARATKEPVNAVEEFFAKK